MYTFKSKFEAEIARIYSPIPQSPPLYYTSHTEHHANSIIASRVCILRLQAYIASNGVDYPSEAKDVQEATDMLPYHESYLLEEHGYPVDMDTYHNTLAEAKAEYEATQAFLDADEGTCATMNACNGAVAYQEFAEEDILTFMGYTA